MCLRIERHEPPEAAMKRFLLPALAAALLAPVALEAGEIRAQTNDGKVVLLRDDGTWIYEPEPKKDAPQNGVEKFEKDPKSVAAYKGKRGKFTLYLIPGRWTQKETPSSPDAEVQFAHKDGDVFGMVIAERLEMPVETLKQVAVGRVQKLDKDFKIVEEGKRIVNGRQVLFVIMDANIKGIPLTYFVYYLAGPEGSIQVFTFTGRSLFKEYRQDMQAFLNGFQLAPLPD
jgi:hypothetical protein